MRRTPLLRTSWLTCGAACLGLFLVCGVPEAGNKTPAARIAAYTSPEGVTYFAVTLPPQTAPAAKNSGADVIFLVDTSASQTGDYRTASLEVVRGVASRLQSEDRAAVIAVDVAAEPLSAGFVSAGSEELEAALQELEDRVPLGAGRLEQGLNAILETARTSRPTNVIYVGDGMSTGKLIAPAALAKMFETMQSQGIAVHGFGVGPRVDVQLLGMLAQHTGGVLVLDRDPAQLQEAVGILADAVRRPLIRDAVVSIQGADVTLYGERLPQRTDREAVILGRGDLPETVTIEIETPQGKSRQRVAVERERDAYLLPLVATAEQSGGLILPVPGQGYLDLARRVHDEQVGQMTTLAEQAAADRQWKDAVRIARDVQRVDPENRVAASVLKAAEGRLVAQNEAPADEPVDDTKPVDDADAPAQPTTEPPGSLLERREEEIRRRTQQMVFEVDRVIKWARSLADSEPQDAVDELKRRIVDMANRSDIDPDVRDQLKKRLEATRTDIMSKLDAKQVAELQAEKLKSETEARQRLVEQIQLDDEKIEQLIARVASLMREGRRGEVDAFEAAEEASRAALALQPGATTPTSALFSAEGAGQLDKAYRLRALRADKFLETLHQVELSHVPFPDEPPVLWPAPEVWKALTEKRRKWRSVDLKRFNVNEERIREALDSSVDVDYIDTPLKEALEQLATDKGISIYFNEQALTDAGVVIDTPVNLRLQKISFRSALKLILEPVDLTYTIEDEVMKFVTKEESKQKRTTRVYPAGDLTIQLNPFMLGGGGLGGGLGGLGGGGLGGLGGFGGFGGFGNVPPEQLDDAPRKKKPNDNR